MTIVLIAAAAVLAAITAVVVWPALKSRLASATPQQSNNAIAKSRLIDDLGDRICLCEMVGRPHDELTEALAKAVEGLESEGLGTSSVPLSGSVTCFPGLSEPTCVGRIEVVADRERFVCTEAQADELDAIWSAARKPGDEFFTASDAALIKRLDAMREELRRTLPQATCRLP